MKRFKLKLYLAAIVGLTVFNSCSDEKLEIIPELNDVLETSIRSEEDVEKYLINSYEQFQSSTLFGANILIHADLMSDNVFVSNKNDGYFLGINSLNITQDGDLGHLGGFYRVIRAANTVLNFENYLAAGVDASTFDMAKINEVQATAKAARGVALFYLANLYASNPTSGQFQEFGVPVYTTPFDPNARFPRSTVEEVYTQIIKDLEESLQYIADVPTDKGYLSKTAVNLVLSRVYLTRGQAGDYAKAIQYADATVNNAPSVFGFVPEADYNTYFSSTDNALSENQPETVWEMNMTAADNPGVNEAISAFYARTGAHASLLFRQGLYDTFDASDVRRTLLTNSGAPTQDDPKGYWTTKWPRNTSEGNFTINVKILRMSEAKLNRIEALYRSGQNATALAELNAFAASRGATTQYTGTDLLADIMSERRKEFYGEGYRFYDLKRNNLGYVKATNCAGTNCNVEATSRFMVLPMPKISELLINPLMTQHPLWD